MQDSIYSLIEIAKEQFQKIGLSKETILTYHNRSFNQIIRRYEKEGECYYQEAIMNELLSETEDLFESGIISRQSRNWRRRGIKILQEIHATGSFQWKVFLSQESKTSELSADLEEIISEFFSTMQLSEHYMDSIYDIIKRFCLFTKVQSVNDFANITPIVLTDFLSSMYETRPHSMYLVVQPLKRFRSFLVASNVISENQWLLLASPKSSGQKVKPVIAQSDLISVLNQVDRSISPGKRDFAILVLAITTGLRAVDVVSLQLSNVFWREQEIRLTQKKTNQRLILPLQISARNALADYILNERPQSTYKEIFLSAYAPFKPLKSGSSVNDIFQKYLSKAGIERQIDDGRTFHGIRRTLGTSMAAEGVPITTIAQVLGHQSIRATKQYIAMDLQGLQNCVLSMEALEINP